MGVTNGAAMGARSVGGAKHRDAKRDGWHGEKERADRRQGSDRLAVEEAAPPSRGDDHDRDAELLRLVDQVAGDA